MRAAVLNQTKTPASHFWQGYKMDGVNMCTTIGQVYENFQSTSSSSKPSLVQGHPEQEKETQFMWHPSCHPFFLAVTRLPWSPQEPPTSSGSHSTLRWGFPLQTNALALNLPFGPLQLHWCLFLSYSMSSCTSKPTTAVDVHSRSLCHSWFYRSPFHPSDNSFSSNQMGSLLTN